MKEFPSAMAKLIAIGFMLIMLDTLVRAFIDPNYRVNVGEPRRIIAGIEVVLGGFSVLWLFGEVFAGLRRAARGER